MDTLASTAGENVHVICACEEECDDIEALVLAADLVIIFKALPLLKCMHKNENFSLEKVY